MEPEIVAPVVDAPPTIDTLASTGSAKEYREARAGKPVADVVAAREPVEDDAAITEPKVPDASEAGRQLAAHKSGLSTRKASIQTEIDTLTRTKHDTKREADAAKAELDALKSELATLKATPKAPEVETKTDDAEPAPEQFDSYDKYVKAQARWEARQEIRQELAAERERNAVEVRTRGYQSALDTMYQAGTQAHPDFEAVVNQAHADNFKFSPDLSLAIADLPNAPEVVYALLSNRADAQRLNALTGVQLGIQLAAIVTRLPTAQSGPVVEAPPVTQATAPIKPVGTTPTASTRSLETVAKAPTNADYRRQREAGAR